MLPAHDMMMDQNHTINKNQINEDFTTMHKEQKSDLVTTTELPRNITNDLPNMLKDEPEHPPSSPTCTSSHPSDELEGAVERLSDLKMYEDDQLGFEFSESLDSNVCDFYDLPMHVEDESDETISIQTRTNGVSILSTSSTVSPSTTEEEDDLLKTKRRGRRTVRFSSCLVTDVHTRPRTSNEEWNDYYYSSHELQRMLDDFINPMRKTPCIIASEEGDLDL